MGIQGDHLLCRVSQADFRRRWGRARGTRYTAKGRYTISSYGTCVPPINAFKVRLASIRSYVNRPAHSKPCSETIPGIFTLISRVRERFPQQYDGSGFTTAIAFTASPTEKKFDTQIAFMLRFPQVSVRKPTKPELFR